jgi:hypothetical protein
VAYDADICIEEVERGSRIRARVTPTGTQIEPKCQRSGRGLGIPIDVQQVTARSQADRVGITVDVAVRAQGKSCHGANDMRRAAVLLLQERHAVAGTRARAARAPLTPIATPEGFRGRER